MTRAVLNGIGNVPVFSDAFAISTSESEVLVNEVLSK